MAETTSSARLVQPEALANQVERILRSATGAQGVIDMERRPRRRACRGSPWSRAAAAGPVSGSGSAGSRECYARHIVVGRERYARRPIENECPFPGDGGGQGAARPGDFRHARRFLPAGRRLWPRPRQELPVAWLFSDITWYRDRSLGLVRRWMEAGAARNFVVTLIFQSETVQATAAEFEAIPEACRFHGDHNTHELTFALLR